MSDGIERALAEPLVAGSLAIGQIKVSASAQGFVLLHRDDADRHDMRNYRSVEDAIAIARFDDAGNYRPLKTAPNLAHGWRLEVPTMRALREALDHFYPGRLAVLASFESGQLEKTDLRETLGRQTGMYRVAASITDDSISDVVGRFCRSDGGCLRTILWDLNSSGEKPSVALPPEKYDPKHDQAQGRGGESLARPFLPLLCQEACNLLISECRKVVRSGRENAAERA